jgi:hypothetical protein
MKHPRLIAVTTLGLTAVALASLVGCASPPDTEGSTSTQSALGPPGSPSGFHEKDLSAVVEKAVENDPSAKIRLVRTATGRRTPHYVAPGVDITLSFVAHATRWIVSGGARYIAAESRTVVCLTTTDTLGVATSATSIQTTCAAIDKGASSYHDAARTGTWIRGITDDGRVLFTRDADPFKPVRFDELGKGCDALALQQGKFVFLGESYCATKAQPGAACSDPCFKPSGIINAEGFCQLPPSPAPFCPAGTVCTGGVDPNTRCR